MAKFDWGVHLAVCDRHGICLNVPWKIRRQGLKFTRPGIMEKSMDAQKRAEPDELIEKLATLYNKLPSDQPPLPGPDLVHRECVAGSEYWRDDGVTLGLDQHDARLEKFLARFATPTDGTRAYATAA